MRRTRRKVHERPGNQGPGLFSGAEFDLAFGHIEGLIPRVGVRRRTSAFRPLLEKDLITAGGFTGCKHRNALADDIQWMPIILRCDNKRLWVHLQSPDL